MPARSEGVPRRFLGIGIVLAVLLAGLGVARLYPREKLYQLAITGRLEGLSDSLPTTLNTKIYLSLPELGRALRPDGRQFELTGGKPYSDPYSGYSVAWNGASFDLRASVSAFRPPTRCLLTIRKLGYARHRGEEFPLRIISDRSLAGEAPPVTLIPGGRARESEDG